MSKVALAVGVTALIAGLTWLEVWVVRWAWNAVLVPVFSWPAITMWQGFALVVLLSLFGLMFRGRSSG